MTKIIRRALSDTTSHLVGLIIAALGGAATLIALFLWKGREMALEEVPYVITGLIGGLGVVLLLFLWNLACAPYRMERDRHSATRAKLQRARDENRRLSSTPVESGALEERLKATIGDLEQSVTLPESGENANGKYLIDRSGNLFCIATLTVEVGSPGVISRSFPAAFAVPPMVNFVPDGHLRLTKVSETGFSAEVTSRDGTAAITYQAVGRWTMPG